MNLDSVYFETSCRITNRLICCHPTAHHTPQRAFVKQRRLLPRYSAEPELTVPPQNQPAKHEYRNTATYYTAKTSIRQAIFEQKSLDSEKNFRRAREGRGVSDPAHLFAAGRWRCRAGIRRPFWAEGVRTRRAFFPPLRANASIGEIPRKNGLDAD
jgi:hypothetical protein